MTGNEAVGDRQAPILDAMGHAFGPGSLGDDDFRRLSRFIESELGIKMPSTKRVMLESRLQKRLRVYGFKSYTAYLDHVFSKEGAATELVHMIDVVTTNKTDFFRESDHFDYLTERILPEFAAEGRTGLKFWSAGCSTGEEPYTLCIVLEEYRARDPSMTYSIAATDISTRALEQAVNAVYDAEKAGVIPMTLKKKYLLRSKDGAKAEVRIKKELRDKVRFSRLNFMDEAYPFEARSFDLAFCRNVIIYFDRETQERILGKICSRIRPGGYLLLGHSETLTGMSLPLRGVAPTIYRKTE